MRTSSAALRGALSGSFDWRWVADVFSNGVRVIQDAPIINPMFNDDASSLVQGTGSCTITYQGDFGDSIAPAQIGDLLAPFGTQVAVSILVTAGDGFQERVPMGVYLLTETPSIVTTRFAFQGAIISKGDRIDLQLKDLFYGVQRDRFDAPSSAPDLSSVWKEVQRLTGLPVTRTVPDGVITTAVAYQEDKLQAVYDLATVLDATAALTADGTVTMRPNVWPAPVATLSYGDGGTLVDVGRAMANDNVYNKVVVRTNGADGTAILATAEVKSGPLRTTNSDGSLSPYRRVPYFYSSEYITTQAQAQQFANDYLPRVSRLRSVSVRLTELLNPLRDLGDVLTVNRLGESFTGRVVSIVRNGSGTQETTVVTNGS